MSKPVVICVDDEPTVLDSLKIELRRILADQCLIEIAEGGEEALELFDELQQDQYEVAVVVADYIMPGMRGDEVLRQVHQRSPTTLTVMLSGQADLDAVGNAIRHAHLYRYITKPWQSEDLGLTLSEAVQSYIQAKQLRLQNERIQQLYVQVTALNTTLEQQVQQRTAQLQTSLHSIQELSQLKDDFLHAVSHDLRIPTTGTILLLKSLLSKATPDVAVSRSLLERMIDSGERQLQLLDSLLEVHFSERYGLQLQTAPLCLEPWVQAIAQDLVLLVSQRQATLHCIFPPTPLPLAQADPLQLRRVFENLIANALNHNPPNIEICIRIALSATVPHTLYCTVQDNGIGIDPAETEHIFDRYSRGTRGRRSVGIGLGLYLCRQIITAHHGTIGVTSTPGQGTTFWFTVPIAEGEQRSSI
jgi:two-component system, sensor histidine kinase and response regulator